MKTGTNRWRPWIPLAMVAGVATGIYPGWTAPEVAAPASPETITVPLHYQEVSYSLMNWGLTVTDQPAAFKREPPVGNAKVRRGRFNFQIRNETPLPFLWDYSRGKLYLDLNRNEDLTDDPAGIFSSPGSAANASSYRHGLFTNVHLPLPAGPGRQPTLLDLNLSEYRGRLNAYAAVRAFWAGKAMLAGREWQVGMIDNPQDNRRPPHSGHLLLRPWKDRNNPFSVFAGSLETFPFAGTIFLQTQSYDVRCAPLLEGGPAQYQLTFQTKPAELGELKLAGAFIQRLHLTGSAGLAVLDAPTATVRVPVGRYDYHAVRLEQGGVVAHLERPRDRALKPLVVAKDKPATLAAGGPLTNHVTVTQRGRHLAFNYKLLGAGGETYELGTRDYQNPPRFAVYQAGQKIASGKFEFG